jgi:hypothetical protein
MMSILTIQIRGLSSGPPGPSDWISDARQLAPMATNVRTPVLHDGPLNLIDLCTRETLLILCFTLD